MTDFTYGALVSSDERKKRREASMAESKAVTDQYAADYAAGAKANTENYTAQMGAAYDAVTKAAEQNARAEAKEAAARYDANFRANEAQQYAAERNLRRQMAAAGMQNSGYNATNQGAIAVARSNADAQTRTAKQQAVDAIMRDLNRYKAEQEAAKAAASADAWFATSQNVLNNKDQWQQAGYGQGLEDYQNELSTDITLRQGIEQHNRELAALAVEAQANGYTEYARQLASQMLVYDAATGTYKQGGADMSATLNEVKAVSDRNYANANNGGWSYSFPQIYEGSVEKIAKMEDPVMAQEELVRLIQNAASIGVSLNDTAIAEMCALTNTNYEQVKSLASEPLFVYDEDEADFFKETVADEKRFNSNTRLNRAYDGDYKKYITAMLNKYYDEGDITGEDTLEYLFNEYGIV